MGKRDHNYFDMFVNAVDYSCTAAKNLHQTLLDFDAAKLPETMKYLHQIEHTADLEKHKLMNLLAREFITPIEREDILLLSKEIDDVTDAIEDVLMRAYMFNVKTIPQEAIRFSALVVKCCDSLRKAMEEFDNFKKSTSIREYLVEVNRLEEEGDQLYMEAVHDLFASGKSSVEILAWTEMYECFERCCDACEDVSDAVESVMMKNS